MTTAGPDGHVGVPVCPRHPDRESYVRCQRCQRPACPQCQWEAAVGIHCVDCVREAAKATPTARTTFGGRATDGRPVVTWTIIGLCVAAHVAQYLPGLDVTERFMLVPAWTAAEPWRLLTSAFLHSTGFFFHILLNMYAVYLMGPYLEHLLGRVRFAVTYLLCALGGSAAYLLVVGGYTLADGRVYLSSALGASGAVFGLFGALFVVQRRLGRQLGQIAVIIGINLVLGFVVSGIAWQAHLGGLVTGVACAAVLAYAPRGKHRLLWQVAGLVLVAALVAAATVIGLAAIVPAR